MVNLLAQLITYAFQFKEAEYQERLGMPVRQQNILRLQKRLGSVHHRLNLINNSFSQCQIGAFLHNNSSRIDKNYSQVAHQPIFNW
uniref:hypothetical protein n=1 Tax=Candidatus Enterovibrio escicola TaxID=1927127 RepID=UPI0012382A7D|nr:hypothetical protein [Candidatus Enterovibrio escacola]